LAAVCGGDENDSRTTVDALKTCPSYESTGRGWDDPRPSPPQSTDNLPTKLRHDPYSWVESVSGHHALVGHVDACFGLEREITALTIGSCSAVSHGNTATSAVLLDEDDVTLRFEVCSGGGCRKNCHEPCGATDLGAAKKLRTFTQGELVKAATPPTRRPCLRLSARPKIMAYCEKKGTSMSSRECRRAEPAELPCFFSGLQRNRGRNHDGTARILQRSAVPLGSVRFRVSSVLSD